MKYTKGPWETSKMSGGDVEIWAVGTPKIAIVHISNVSFDELKSNVALIAAAPELFERLQKIVEEWNDENRDDNKLFDSFYEARLLIDKIKS